MSTLLCSSAPWWILPVPAGLIAPLAAVGVNAPLPLDSNCSGEATVTSLICPSAFLAAVTVPAGGVLTSLGLVWAGSLMGGASGSPSELTILALFCSPRAVVAGAG